MNSESFEAASCLRSDWLIYVTEQYLNNSASFTNQRLYFTHKWNTAILQTHVTFQRESSENADSILVLELQTEQLVATKQQ